MKANRRGFFRSVVAAAVVSVLPARWFTHRRVLPTEGGGTLLKNGKRYIVAYWDCALTAEEVQDLYLGVSPGQVRPDKRLLWWPDNENRS